MSSERILLFRKRAAECHHKAAAAKTEEMRRAWQIAAREWEQMARREEDKVPAEARS